MQFDTLFQSVFESSSTLEIDIKAFVICIVAALLLGVFIAALYMYKTRHTQSFVITLAIIPAVVSVVIMMVNGNIGAGVAVAGAFSLVRFRSVPGTAKEIGAIFLAMGAGLAVGMGYIGFSVVFVAIVSLVNLMLTSIAFGAGHETQKILQITMPENLDYGEVFEDVFEMYTNEHSLCKVKTTNMGNLLKLTYDDVLRAPSQEKQFIDALRCRNGNLEIVLAKHVDSGTEL